MRHLQPVIALALGTALAFLFLLAPAALLVPLEITLIVLSLAMVLVKLWMGTPYRHRLILSWLFLILIPGITVVRASRTPVPNPDPNHTHADFAVWIGDEKLDFSAAEFMSGLSTDADHDNEEGNRKYLHLHDGNGSVAHRHKPGLTLGNFFETLGTTFRTDGLNLCVDFPQTPEVCQDEAMHKDWIMVVNGAQMAFDPAYVFADTDKILLYFNESGETPDARIKELWAQMTDDACKYSKTCPWKGEPPTENCIADPTVPCVVQ